VRVYARGKLGKTSYLRKIILKKTFRCRPKLPDGTNDVCVGSCDVCTRSGTMGNDHVGVCARGKKFKKSERKKVAEEKKPRSVGRSCHKGQRVGSETLLKGSRDRESPRVTQREPGRCLITTWLNSLYEVIN
jgi:hypothetical protein